MVDCGRSCRVMIAVCCVDGNCVLLPCRALIDVADGHGDIVLADFFFFAGGGGMVLAIFIISSRYPSD